MPAREFHHSHRAGWLRAAVLGANDGVLSTSSLLLGVAASHAARGSVLVAGLAGLVAGAMAMAAGEYVSVSSQADAEQADLVLERAGLDADLEVEQDELAAIYVARGLTKQLARDVALQLMARDALAAHARDEIGITDLNAARPLQASIVSGASFSAGAALPLLAAMLATEPAMEPLIAGTSLLVLALLGALAARAGGANMRKGALRVAFWGALAMAVTTGIGTLVGAPL